MSILHLQARAFRRIPPALEFTPERLQAAISAARARGADGPPGNIWVDIFEAEHLLHYRSAGLASLERLTRLLEEYVQPLR